MNKWKENMSAKGLVRLQLPASRVGRRMHLGGASDFDSRAPESDWKPIKNPLYVSFHLAC